MEASLNDIITLEWAILKIPVLYQNV